MKCKKVGAYIFCSTLSGMLCIRDNVEAMRRVSAISVVREVVALLVDFMQAAASLYGIRAAQSLDPLRK